MPNRELDADGSSESEDTSASFESQAKYDAPPVLTALTEMYQDGKHAYMCVEYSQAMKADAAIANETQSSLSARKGVVIQPPIPRSALHLNLAQSASKMSKVSLHIN